MRESSEQAVDRPEERRPVPAARRAQTAQVPPQPMVTCSPSTITGTLRLPSLNPSIRFIPSGSFFTSKYSTGTFFLAKSSRAATVYGQPAFPKIRTPLSMGAS